MRRSVTGLIVGAVFGAVIGFAFEWMLRNSGAPFPTVGGIATAFPGLAFGAIIGSTSGVAVIIPFTDRGLGPLIASIPAGLIGAIVGGIAWGCGYIPAGILVGSIPGGLVGLVAPYLNEM